MLRNSQAKSDVSPIKTAYEVRQLANSAFNALLSIAPGLMMTFAAFREYFIDQVVLTAYCESKFNNNAVGSAGEIGLMQIKPATARDIESRILKYKENKPLTDPYYNVLLGSAYLASQIQRYTTGATPAWDYGIQAYQKGSFNKSEYPTPYLLNHYAMSEELYAGGNNPFSEKLSFYASRLKKGGNYASLNNKNRLEWL